MPKRLSDAEAAALDRKATRTVGLALMVPGGLILFGGIAAFASIPTARGLWCPVLIGLPLFLAGAQRLFWPRAFKNEGRRDFD